MLILSYLDDPLDGACTAAAVIHHCRITDQNSALRMTSSYSIAKTLRDIADNDSPQPVLICGVGINVTIGEVATALKILRDRKFKVTWISGRPFPNGAQNALDGLCKFVVDETSGSDLALTTGYLHVLKDEQLTLIGHVAALHRYYDSDQKPPQQTPEKAIQLFLCARRALNRFFQFADHNSFPLAVDKLAGLRELDDEDKSLNFDELEDSHALSGRSPAIKELRRIIGKVAPARNTPVLILGESGSGKEIVARLLHQGSGRAGKFQAANCATFRGTEMLNAQLFGYVKGAFTGAISGRKGLFELAHRGTLFLDEIGEMTLESQGALLRVLEQHRFYAIGDDNKIRESDARIIAATNRDLAQMVREGKFRADLYYRLKIVTVRVPPLRERIEDLDLLLPDLLRGLGEKLNIPAPSLTPEQTLALKRYAWPGNVRQLAGFLEAAIVCDRMDEFPAMLAEEEMTAPATAVPQAVTAPPPPATADTASKERASLPVADAPDGHWMTMQAMQTAYSRRVLEGCGGNKSATAKTLGISINTLKKYLDGE